MSEEITEITEITYITDDFNTWSEGFKTLVNCVFDIKDYTYVKKDELEWLTDDFIKKYPMFENLKSNTINNVFAFLVAFNKYGIEKRLEIYKAITKKEIKTSFYGVPANQQGINTKAFETLKNMNKILNKIAYILINIEDSKRRAEIEDLEDYKSIENITATAKNTFYLLAPEEYYPSDSNTTSLLGKDNLLNIKLEDKYLSRATSYFAVHKGDEVSKIFRKLIKSKSKAKNLILTGMPGTGKTYSIMKFLKNNKYNDGMYEFVQFHPSYDYEDFIEGLKPFPSKINQGQIEFKLVDGIFKKLCKEAFKNKEKIFVMIIDEINRANLSRVFGELLYCLEYRDEFVSTKMTTYIESLDNEEAKKYSIDEDNIGKFAIPNNVIILGTMNEVDRSIDAFDLALRRRFIWEDIGFNDDTLRYVFIVKNGMDVDKTNNLIKSAKNLNTKLDKDIGINYQLGHTYYFKIIDYYDKENNHYKSALCDLWNYHLKSILKEYCKIKFGENDIEKKLEEYRKIIIGDKNNCYE